MILRVVLDFNEINLNTIVNVFQKSRTDFCIDKDSIFIYTQEDDSFVKKLLKKSNVTNYFLKAINEIPEVGMSSSFSDTWINEKIRYEIEEKFNRDNQEKLLAIQNSVDQANLKLDEITNKKGE